MATTLVLLPGLDGTEVLLRPLVAALPPALRPIVITYPTAGHDDYATLLELVRQAIAGVQDCYVLGWSFAGPLALMLAAAEPRRVRGVILAASFVRPPTPVLTRLRFALVPLIIWTWRAARRLPLALRDVNDPLRRAKAETWRRVPARAIAARLRAVAAVDAAALLRSCQRPVLYIASATDGIVPRRNAVEVLGLAPQAKMVSIAGKHLALFSNPQAAAAAIVAFVGHQAVTTVPVYRAASA